MSCTEVIGAPVHVPEASLEFRQHVDAVFDSFADQIAEVPVPFATLRTPESLLLAEETLRRLFGLVAGHLVGGLIAWMHMDPAWTSDMIAEIRDADDRRLRHRGINETSIEFLGGARLRIQTPYFSLSTGRCHGRSGRRSRSRRVRRDPHRRRDNSAPGNSMAGRKCKTPDTNGTRSAGSLYAVPPAGTVTVGGFFRFLVKSAKNRPTYRYCPGKRVSSTPSSVDSRKPPRYDARQGWRYSQSAVRRRRGGSGHSVLRSPPPHGDSGGLGSGRATRHGGIRNPEITRTSTHGALKASASSTAESKPRGPFPARSTATTYSSWTVAEDGRESQDESVPRAALIRCAAAPSWSVGGLAAPRPKLGLTPRDIGI